MSNAKHIIQLTVSLPSIAPTSVNMTERYNEVEQSMGICAYASSENEGFAAVLKARYSDFCVHEGTIWSTVPFL